MISLFRKPIKEPSSKGVLSTPHVIEYRKQLKEFHLQKQEVEELREQWIERQQTCLVSGDIDGLNELLTEVIEDHRASVTNMFDKVGIAQKFLYKIRGLTGR